MVCSSADRAKIPQHCEETVLEALIPFLDFERSLDTTIFMLLALIGFGILILSYILGEVTGLIGDFGDGVEATDGVINVHTVSAFFAGFGAFGWLLSGYWGVSPIVAAFGGLAGGVPLAGAVMLAGRLLARQAGSTNFTRADLVGEEAIVTLRIPSGGVGYVEYRTAGGRHRTVARSNDGDLIPEGTVVRIERVIAGEVMVTTRLDEMPQTSTAEV